MSIKDLEQVNARQLENIRRKQSGEIKRLEEGHQELKADIKKSHESELVDINHQNFKQVATESEKKEKVLTQMKQHLDETKKLTDKQIDELKEHSSKVKQVENEKLNLERERVKSEHDLTLEDLNYRFTKGHKEVVSKNQEKIEKLKDIKSHEIADKEAYFENRLNQQTNEFAARYSTDSTKYKKIKDDQDKQFKDERMSTNLRQQTDLGKMSTTHTQVMEVKEQEFRRGLKDQNLGFEKKYAENLQTRTDELDRLEKLNTKVESKLKGELSEKLVGKITRSEDPFYRFTELKPTLKQFEDRVEISVEVPEHSKADVQLTINNKEAIISMSRRYDDSRKDGSTTNKLHKVESFTSRIGTNHYLDAKTVKANYDDGVMTYIVKHA